MKITHSATLNYQAEYVTNIQFEIKYKYIILYIFCGFPWQIDEATFYFLYKTCTDDKSKYINFDLKRNLN